MRQKTAKGGTESSGLSTGKSSNLFLVFLTLFLAGKQSDAEPLFREALEGSKRVLGDSHPKTLEYKDDLARCLDEQGMSQNDTALYFDQWHP